jgi:drug/metabolite transporter (DMT)-like permease
MGLQVIFWQQSLKYYSLSFAYPFRSMVSFIVLFSAYFLFGESITLLNIVGLAIISLGIFYLVKDKEFLN